MSRLRDAARLLLYFAAALLAGALLAPPLFWGGQWLVQHGFAVWLAKYDFETFFHRALLVAVLVLLWPLLRSLKVKSRHDLGLQPNRTWRRDTLVGFLIAGSPLLFGAQLILQLGWYKFRGLVAAGPLLAVIASSIIVPLIEEALFRGLILGVLLRAGGTRTAIVISAAIFSVLHFLKAPEHTTIAPTWTSGLTSIGHAFTQFTDPMLLAAGFTTLFLLGLIMADARVRTRSLWCPIGLHAGWILVNGVFNKLAHREVLALPWLGRNLLVGIIPLCIALISWGALHLWLNHDREKLP